MAQAIKENEAFLDSAATSNFSNNSTNLTVIGPSNKRLAVADGRVIEATHAAKLPLANLSDAARTTTIVPELEKSLLSVAVLADNGYTTIFRPYNQGAEVYAGGACDITASQPPVLQGCRDDNGLWVVPIEHEESGPDYLDLATEWKRNKPQKAHHDVAANVYELPSTREVVWFLHAALGFPTKQTLLAAIRNNQLTSFPGLTAEAVARHFPESDETQKGHMRQTRQGVRSTKVVDEDAIIFKPSPGVKHKDVYLRVYNATKKTMYSDQTGRFPVVSIRGNKYVMVACELDGNYIDAEPMRDRTTTQ